MLPLEIQNLLKTLKHIARTIDDDAQQVSDDPETSEVNLYEISACAHRIWDTAARLESTLDSLIDE